ncbi:zinc ribbon domain-containing protein [Methanocella conradii]|uniref:zinc ribbon domain-containing protein n=1 Tax=Methanocella conradii TaxID=1175444 RepID=UPI0020C5EAC0|nr:zinc ribbon domain-containing protein [Methanocella conradii]
MDTRETSSYGGIDQGLNRTIATVLLDGVPRGELLYEEKRKLLDKYDDIIESLQRAGKTRKLKQLRNKRSNVSIYHDWCLANKVVEYTDGYDIAIGNTMFRQTQYRGNGMPMLRKRIGKWSYGRQRCFIAHKRAERGLSTKLIDERNTSNTCHCCGSRLVARKYHERASWILCHSCESKLDADLNAAYNIAAGGMTG